MVALAETEQEAIAKVAMHNREHVVLIRPTGGGLILHTLYYEDELHQANKAGANKAGAPQTKFSAKELQMAKSLVQHLSGKFKLADFHDTYRENVERLVEEKKKGERITTVKQPRKAPVIDLMAALKKSLAATAGRGTVAKKTVRKRKAA